MRQRRTPRWRISIPLSVCPAEKRMIAIPFTYEHLKSVEFIDKAVEFAEEVGVQRIMAKSGRGFRNDVVGCGWRRSGWHDYPTSRPGFICDRCVHPESVADVAEEVQTLVYAHGGDWGGYEYDGSPVGEGLADTNVMMAALVERENSVPSGSVAGIRS